MMNEVELKKIIELASYPHPTSFQDEESNKYYERVFAEITLNKIFKWNWAACCWGSAWLIYRKMYLMSFVMLAINSTIFLILLMVPDYSG